MATYAVDSSRQLMKATGIVGIVREWVDSPDGKRRPSDRQARNEDTGMPLWQVEVAYVQTHFGEASTATAKVTVGSEDRPVTDDGAPVVFVGLTVEARTNKAGGLVESWSADGVAETKPSSGKGAPSAGTSPERPSTTQSSAA